VFCGCELGGAERESAAEVLSGAEACRAESKDLIIGSSQPNPERSEEVSRPAEILTASAAGAEAKDLAIGVLLLKSELSRDCRWSRSCPGRRRTHCSLSGIGTHDHTVSKSTCSHFLIDHPRAPVLQICSMAIARCVLTMFAMVRSWETLLNASEHRSSQSCRKKQGNRLNHSIRAR
jgi:hypothetical protein